MGSCFFYMWGDCGYYSWFIVCVCGFGLKGMMNWGRFLYNIFSFIDCVYVYWYWWYEFWENLVGEWNIECVIELVKLWLKYCEVFWFCLCCVC